MKWNSVGIPAQMLPVGNKNKSLLNSYKNFQFPIKDIHLVNLEIPVLQKLLLFSSFIISVIDAVYFISMIINNNNAELRSKHNRSKAS